MTSSNDIDIHATRRSKTPSRAYLDLIGVQSPSDEVQKQTLAEADRNGKSQEDAGLDIAAVALAGKLHRAAMATGNRQALAKSQRAVHDRAIGSGRGAADIAKADAASAAESLAIAAVDAGLQLARLRNFRPDLFDHPSPYFTLNGTRQAGDESPAD
jgi:hypothetical protein